MKGQTAVPQAGDELEELLNDIPRLGASLQEGTFAPLVKDYIAKWTSGNDDMLALFREQTQLGMQQVFQDLGALPAAFRPGAAPALSGRGARKARAITRSRLRDAARVAEDHGLFNPEAIGAAVDDEEYGSSFGKFFHACYIAERARKDAGDTAGVERIQDFKKKLANALGERVPSEGGFLVPENLRSEIEMLALEHEVVMPRARVIPMDSLRVPIPTVDDVSHASSVFGGVQAFWTEEGASLSASAPSFGRTVLEAKKLTAYTSIPNELLQDSIIPLDAWFSMFFPQALAFFRDVAFISGTGVGEPQGFLNAPAAVRVPVGTDYTIVFADIAKAFSRMWPPSLASAVWLCSPDVLVQLLQLAVTASSTGVSPPLFLGGMQAIETPGGGSGDGINYTLMGRPLIVSEKMPSSTSGNTTTPGALTFVDLQQYLVGDRQSMQIASSAEYLFGQDLIAYRVVQRMDGRCWIQSALTPENGSSNTLSPVVKLDTTATS